MSDNYGMLSQGFVPKNLSKLISENMTLFREYFGQDIDSTPMNPVVKINDVHCRGLDRLWMELGNYFDSGQIQFASGRFLRDLGNQMGLPQKDAEKASTRLTFYKTGTSDIVIPEGTVIDNNSRTFLKEFETTDRVEMPGVFVIQRGAIAGGADAINGYPGFTDFFNIENDIEWVSDNLDGSTPYTVAADYNLTLVGGFVTSIDWAPGGAEPAAGAIYYVKVHEYSGYIDVEAVTAGAAYNAEINEIYNLQSTISGIAKVTNDEVILNGRNIESELQHRRRMLNSGYVLKEDSQMEAFLAQLHRIESARVETIINTGHFRSLIYPAETNANAIVSIYNEAINEVETRKGAGTQSVAIVRLIRGGGAGGTDVFPSPYSQTQGVSGTWQIDWVSDNMDGIAPYTVVADYVAYTDYDNEIDWSPGGAEPGGGNQYFVKLVKVVEISETFPVEVVGRLVLHQGYDLSTVNNDLFILLNDYIKTVGIAGILYWSEIIRIINAYEGVQYVDNLYIVLLCRIWKGAAGTADMLPINGSGYSDEIVAGAPVDVAWVNDEKDQSGVAYVSPADYTWDVTGAGQRSIDWAPGGAEPTQDDPYWVSVDIKGDINLPDDALVVLSGVTFT